jgi:glyoxylase-like metal-dependent hydrolase (beta-lactamase superfamily II)
VYVPSKEILCTGDMFIWCFPNCGNPQKVQRYPVEWAQALREMASKGAKMLLPGHGPPIVG